MIIFVIIFVLIDIISKYLVVRSIGLNEAIILIKNFLNITYVRNTGVAFSMLPHNRYLVLVVSLFIIIGIIYYLYKNKVNNRLEEIGYALILGGAISNFIDRLVHGYVIDFIDVKIFNYDYPIFNLADTFIVMGVILLVIYAWRCKDGSKGNGK